MADPINEFLTEISEIDRWHQRRGTTIRVDVKPTEAQHREIEWRACTGQTLNVETTGPRSAFRVWLTTPVRQISPRRQASLATAKNVGAPLWMYEDPPCKVLLLWARLEEIGPDLFKHKT